MAKNCHNIPGLPESSLREYVERQQVTALTLEQMLEALSALMEAKAAPAAQAALVSAAWTVAGNLNRALGLVNLPEGEA